MSSDFSRRELLGFGAVGASLLICAAWPISSRVEESGNCSLNVVAGDGFSGETAIYEECPACNGSCHVRCSACDGTGLWSAESESAGLHKREWARQTGHCAWCSECGAVESSAGEVDCGVCEGRGVILAFVL